MGPDEDRREPRYVLAWGRQFIGGNPDRLFVDHIEKAAVFDEASARDVMDRRPEKLDMVEVEVREKVAVRRIVRPKP